VRPSMEGIILQGGCAWKPSQCSAGLSTPSNDPTRFSQPELLGFAPSDSDSIPLGWNRDPDLP
jgi:hypothetical protein